MSSYRDLQVWQKAMDLVVALYADTCRYLEHEPAQTLVSSANEIGRMINGLLRSLRTTTDD